MKDKLILLTILLALSTSTLFAQDARSILDKASDNYNRSGIIVAKFTLDVKDLKENQTFSQDGTAYMKGDQFKIDIPEAISWFDGKTQWTYIKNTEEVNITNPTGAELQAISPSVLFSIYKTGFDLKYKGTKTIKGQIVYNIEMIAQDKKADLTKILVEIDKNSNSFSKIILYDKNGMENTLTINSYKPNQSLTESIFKFNAKDYPDAEIIDLR